MDAMNRSFSVDDLVGGIFRLGQAGAAFGNFARTDSEAAFQEFLKRIPSATNLAAAANQQYEPGQLQQQAQQLFATSGAGASMPAGLSEAGQNEGGMPRVPSLDLLRQLVIQNQLSQGASQPAMVKQEASAGMLAPPATTPVPALSAPIPALSVPPTIDPVSVPTGVDPSTLSALGTVPGLAAAAAAANTAMMVNPAAAAAAALQLQQLQAPLQHMRSVSNDRSGDYDKSETRRQRRMLSNRESARRSRKRKQEHMQQLEMQIEELQEQKREKEVIADMAERKCHSLEDENQRLREENARLRDELRFLRTELTERKERNSYYRHERSSDAGQQDAAADAVQAYHAGTKRLRSSDAAAGAADGKAVADDVHLQQNGKQHGVGEGHPMDPTLECAQQPAVAAAEDDL